MQSKENKGWATTSMKKRGKMTMLEEKADIENSHVAKTIMGLLGTEPPVI